MNPDLPGRFHDLIGPHAVATGDAAQRFAVDGMTPQCVLLPANVDELRRFTATAHAGGLAVIPAGNGTQLGVGRPPTGYDVALSTRRMKRVVAHEAADMTVTVEAGASIAELNAALFAAGQRLPVDPPDPDTTTIGALIATDVSGPLRLSQGKVRDLLIGITAVLADGTLVKGGGRVVKNVAGYDLMKLFTGSFGTLGIIAQATFKVRPCPADEAVFVRPAATTAAAVAGALDVLSSALAPSYVEALNRACARSVGLDAPAVVVGCAGSAEEVAVQWERLRGQRDDPQWRKWPGDEGLRLYGALRDFTALRNPSVGWRVSLLPSKLPQMLQRIEDEAHRYGWNALMLAHVGSGVASFRFAGKAESEDVVAFAQWLRKALRAAGGWVVFDALPTVLKQSVDPWGEPPPAMALMRGIKQALDPGRRLSPGRFVGGI